MNPLIISIFMSDFVLVQVAGLVSCAMLLVVMLALGPYFKTLPNVSSYL